MHAAAEGRRGRRAGGKERVLFRSMAVAIVVVAMRVRVVAVVRMSMAVLLVSVSMVVDTWRRVMRIVRACRSIGA